MMTKDKLLGRLLINYWLHDRRNKVKTRINGGFIMEVTDQVLDFLKKSDKPLKGGEIAEGLGIDKKEVDKAIKKLKMQDLIESPKACFYQAK